FAEDVVRGGVGGLKVLVDLAEVVGGGKLNDRKFLANADVVPVAIVFREIANGFIRIEEDIFVPVIADALNLDAAPLEADDFVIGAAKFAARAEGNERWHFSGSDLKFLQDLKIGIFRVEDAVATFADYGFGVSQRAKRDGRAALRAVQGFRLRFRRNREG